VTVAVEPPTWDDFVAKVANGLGFTVESIETWTPASRLQEDLLLDSLALFELWLLAEEGYGVTLEPELFESIETAGELHQWVSQLLSGGPR
jgi:acyl carrier protein